MAVGRTLWNRRVVVRDGTEIALDVVLPPGDGPFPTVVSRTPYMRGQRLVPGGFARLVDYGYAYVVVDMRGRGDSDGAWRPFIKDPEDAYDVIEWIAAQSWSTGRIGMVGASYGGLSQWWTAASRPPHLSCIVPMAVGVAREGARSSRNTGVPVQYWAWWLHFVLGRTAQNPGAPSWENGITHLPLSALDAHLGLSRSAWQRYVTGEIDYLSQDFALSDEEFSAIDIPVLVSVGWWDDQTTMATWLALQAAKSAADCRLLIGGWDHAGNASPRPVLGGIDVAASVMDTIAYVERFLALHLKGERPDPADAPRCRIFRTGENRWEDLDEWPAPSTPVSFQLDSQGSARFATGDGLLRIDEPMGAASDSFTYDPNHPSRDMTQLAAFAWSDPPLDSRYLLRRDDTLTYTTKSFDAPLRVSGRIEFELCVSSDCVDTDIMVAVFDVSPDDRTLRIGMAAIEGGGALRLAFRDGPEPKPLVPGEPVLVSIPGSWLHHTFQRGHALRISIGSNGFPFFARNPGTGNHWAQDTTLLPQTNTVHHTPERPSRVVLPVQSEDGG